MTECKHDWVGRCGKLSQGHCFSCLEARAETAERERDEADANYSRALEIYADHSRTAEAALERARRLVDEWGEHPTGCQFLKGLPCDCWISKVLSPEPVRAPETWPASRALEWLDKYGPEPVRTEGAPKPEEPEMADFEIAPAAAMQMVLDERDALRARVAELEAIVKIWRESAELRAQECPECTAVAPSHKFSCSRMGGGQLVVSVDRVVAPEAPGEKEGGA